jgi:hypothetical protein
MPHVSESAHRGVNVSDSGVAADLEQLGLATRHLIDVTAANVSEPFSDEARAGIRALESRLVEAGVDRVVAERVLTGWTIAVPSARTQCPCSTA